VSTLVAEPFVRPWARGVAGVESGERPQRRTRTLAELVTGALADVTATGAAVCPVCGGNLAALHAGAHAAIAGGHCTDCGSTLD
jgi:hypothetical protein